MKQVRVLLVDDCPAFLDSAADFLSRDERVCVVGQAVDGAEGVRLAEALSPDLVFMDLVMPRLDGLAATQLIKSHAPSARVVIVSASEAISQLRRAADAGADGYIAKSQFAEGILAVIDSYFDGPASAAVFVAVE